MGDNTEPTLHALPTKQVLLSGVRMKPKIQEVSSSTTDTVSVWQGLGLHCSVAPPGSDTNVPFQICRILFHYRRVGQQHSPFKQNETSPPASPLMAIWKRNSMQGNISGDSACKGWTKTQT